MADPISNSEDIIDSRSVIERLDELQDERNDLKDEVDEVEGEFQEHAGLPYAEASAKDIENDAKLILLEDQILARRATLAGWDEENGEELKQLTELTEQGEGYCSDWRHGAQLIRDSYFEDYAREFAEDIGAINRDATWPNDCIDWEQAARELQMDYTAIEFGDVTYWVR